MTKILVECPALIASVRVGVLEPLQPLQKRGQCEIRYKKTTDVIRQDIAWCDILITVRGSEYPTLKVVEAAKAAGKFLIYFLDDDLLDIPGGMSSTAYYSDPIIKGYIVGIVSLCDVLWAVNPRILEKYSVWCSRTVLSKVPAQILKEGTHNSGEKIHVLYAGSVDHNRLVQEKLAPAVSRILKDYSDKIDFTFIGANPKLQGLDGVKYYAYFDSYDAYQKVMLNGAFDVGLAPGYRIPFYSCKYFNKFIEYSQYGIAGIYENYPPFTDIVTDGQNGILCGETSDDWYMQLLNLVEGRNDLHRLAVNAQETLRKCFSPEKIVQELISDIPELLAFHGSDHDAAKIRLPSMKYLFYEERIRQLCRTYGIGAIFVIPWKAIRKIWRYIRKKVSG